MLGRITQFLYGAAIAIVAPALVVQLTAGWELPKMLVALLGSLAFVPGCFLVLRAMKD